MNTQGCRILLGAVLGVMGSAIAASGQTTLTWSQKSANAYWSKGTAYTNWTADAGATYVAWTDGANAVFDGEPPAQVSVYGPNLGMTFNRLTVTNIADGAMTISKVSGGDLDYLIAAGDSLIDVSTGTALTLPRVSGTSGLRLRGGGTIVSNRDFIYTGGTAIEGGTLQTAKAADLRGPIYLLDSSGSLNARIYLRGNNTSWTSDVDLVARGGSTGTAIFENSPTSGTRYFPTLSGDLIVTNTLRFTTAGKPTVFTLSGAVSGPGDLELAAMQNTDGYVLTGDSSEHTGDLLLTNTGNRTSVTNRFDGIQGHCRITVGANWFVTGTGTLTCNVVGDTAEGITLATTATLDVSGLSLAVAKTGSQTKTDFVLVDRRTRVSGMFASVTGGEVIYAGTTEYPNAVVLRVPLDRATLVTVR